MIIQLTGDTQDSSQNKKGQVPIRKNLLKLLRTQKEARKSFNEESTSSDV